MPNHVPAATHPGFPDPPPSIPILLIVTAAFCTRTCATAGPNTSLVLEINPPAGGTITALRPSASPFSVSALLMVTCSAYWPGQTSTVLPAEAALTAA